MMTRLDMRGRKNVHLNCSERKKESEGQHLWPPHTAQGGGRRRGKELQGRTLGQGRDVVSLCWLPQTSCGEAAKQGSEKLCFLDV